MSRSNPVPAITGETNSLRIWQEQLLDWILRGIFALWIIVFFMGLNNIREGWQEELKLHKDPWLYTFTVACVYVGIMLGMSALTFYKRLGYTVRAVGMLTVIFLLGLVGLILSGLSGDGRVFFLAFVGLAAVFLTPRQSMISVALSVAALGAVGWAIVSGRIFIPAVRLLNSTVLTSWISGTLVFVTLSVALVVSITHLVGSFQKNVAEVEREKHFVSTVLETMSAMVFVLNGRGEIVRCNRVCFDIGGYSAEEMISRRFWEFNLTREDSVRARELFKQIIAEKDARELEGSWIAKNGARLHIRWKFTALPHTADADETVIVTGIDLTEGRRTEEIVRRQFDELTVLQAISTAGTMSAGEDALIENATQIMYEALFTHNCGVLLVDENAGVLIGHPSYRSIAVDRPPVPLGRGVTGAVALEGVSRLIRDVGEENNYLAYDGLTRSELCVPIKIGNRVIGVLNVESDQPDRFDESDERLLTTIAGQLAIGIENARLYTQNEEAYLETIIALARTIDARDRYTSDHSKQLSHLAEKTALKMNLPQDDLDAIRWAGLLHDIGKIGIPDDILRKPGPLNEKEMEIIRQHPTVGANIVAPVKRLTRVAPLIRAHQEKFDGSGYPDGLKRKAIPLGARILAVVDAYDAMTDNRVYRKAVSPDLAVAELCQCAGAHFDPDIVKNFLAVLEDELGRQFNCLDAFSHLNPSEVGLYDSRLS